MRGIGLTRIEWTPTFSARNGGAWRSRRKPLQQPIRSVGYIVGLRAKVVMAIAMTTRVLVYAAGRVVTRPGALVPIP